MIDRELSRRLALILACTAHPASAQEAAGSAPPPSDPGPLNPPVDASRVPAAEANVPPPRPVPAWLRNRSVVRETSLFVKNGLAARLSCRVGGPNMPADPFTIGGGGEFSRTVPIVGEGQFRIRCGRPTDGVTYRLRPGARHVFLMNPQRGLGELRTVDFGSSR